MRKEKIIFVIALLYIPLCYGQDIWHDELGMPTGDSFRNISMDYLFDQEGEKTCFLQLSLDCNGACEGAGCSGSIPLAQSIFGQCFTLSDISLFLKLSETNKVAICVEPGQTTVPADRPPGSTTEFCGYSSDLYTTLLAPTNVCLDAWEKEFEFGINIASRFAYKEKCDGYVGLNIPIQHRVHDLTLEFCGGKLFSASQFSSGSISRTNSLFQFYQDYSSIYDFFVRGILADKDLKFDPYQCKTGIGDISLFSILDFGPATNRFDAWQFGMNILLPSGGTIGSDKVWQVHLGNGGAYQFEFFTNMLIDVGSPCWSPTLRAAVNASIPFTACFRVPQCKKLEEADIVQDIEGLDYPGPSIFPNFFVLPYQEVDSPIPGFADEALPTKIQWGTQYLVGIGSYFYDIFLCNFRAAVFYDYSGKTKDRYTPTCCKNGRQFVPSVIESLTEQHAHRLGWNLAYTFKNDIELLIGSQHVFAGKNVPLTNDIFASLVLMF